MKIFLLHYATKESKITEALGICYIASYLRKNDYEVDIFDSRIEEYDLDDYIEEVLNRIDGYSMVGISLTQMHSESIQKLVDGIRKSGYEGHVFLGGYGPTINWEKMCGSGVDSVVIGEGEYIVKNLADNILSGKEWRRTKGIAYLNEKGEAVRTKTEELPILDDIPYPSRDILDGFAKKVGKETLNPLIQGSRGCYMRCAYCSTPVFLKNQGGKVHRLRSIKNIVGEIKELYNDGYSNFDFVDDNFLPANKEQALVRARELREELHRENIKVTFFMEFRLENISLDLLKELKEAGLRRLLIGIESFNEEDLKLYNRTYPLDKLHEAMDTIFEAGFGTDLNSEYRFKYGYININPLSTAKSLLNSGEMFKKYGLTYKKLYKRLVLYDNNSQILGNILKDYPEYSEERYFKEKSIDEFYNHFLDYNSKYLKLRNVCRNVEKVLIKRSNKFHIDIKEDIEKLEMTRYDLDQELYNIYMNGLRLSEKEGYEFELKEFFSRKLRELENVEEEYRNRVEEVAVKRDIPIYENERFFSV